MDRVTNEPNVADPGNLAAVPGHVHVVTSPEETKSDTELWDLSRRGDTDAFGLLFERHAKQIYNYCFRATGDWTTAEDLLSLTFLEAWRRRGTELAEGKVLAWLYGVAINVIRNRRRSERRYAAAMKRVPAPDAEPDFAGSSDIRLDDERQMRDAIVRLAQLPEHERDAFLLCVCMEATYDDAALALSVPVGTVRSRLSRARKRLRELESARGHIGEKSGRAKGGV